MSDGFQRTLDHIRSIAGSEAEKGRFFERLMKTYFIEGPLYKERFSDVRLWSEWAGSRPGFITVSAQIVVDTGDGWGPNAVRIIAPLKPPCTALRFGDLVSRPFDWLDLVRAEPDALAFRDEPFGLRTHQQARFNDVTDGFAVYDRGKLVMACGSGNVHGATHCQSGGRRRQASSISGAIDFAVRAIHARVGHATRVLALLRRDLFRHARRPQLRGCVAAGIRGLATTDPVAILLALREARPDAMTVVFCAYHSLGVVEHAQDNGAPTFDFVLCDEAHRTTGVERPGDRMSPFVLVHGAQRIRAT